MPVEVFMGAVDVERQALNVYVMKLLGATVHPVESGTRTLKDATNEAFRDWAGRVDDTFYIIGSVVGAHPYPYMVREFQKVIGIEARAQVLERYGRLPTRRRRLRRRRQQRDGDLRGLRRRPGGASCGASRRRATASHAIETAASINAGTVGILHGSRSYVLQTAEGQVRDTHSISAGLDYPGVGPEHAFLSESGRATLRRRRPTKKRSRPIMLMARSEGIVPALESAHAIAYARKLARERGRDGLILVNLSGRGDKDMRTVAALDAAAPAAVLT